MKNAVAVTDLNNHTVLIIEDEISEFLNELEVSLNDAGAETVVARSLSQARRCLERFAISAALIDYKAGLEADFWELIAALGAVPVLLCCSEAPPPSGWHDIRFVTRPARMETIVTALGIIITSDGMRRYLN